MAISATAAAASAYGQSQQAQEQATYQQDMLNKTGVIANENLARQSAQANTSLYEQEVSLDQQGLDNQVSAQQALGKAQASADSAGIEGNSVQALMADFQRQAALNNSALTTNLGFAQAQTQQQLLGYAADARSQVNSRVGPPIPAPNYIGSALSIGSTLLGGMDNRDYRLHRGAYAPAPLSS
jgi:hypothetical protein